MAKKSRADEELADHIIEQLASAGPISKRPLFGALALYRGGVVFAMTWKGSLYFKVDEFTRSDYEGSESHALEYVSQGEQQSLKSFWEVPAHIVENPEKLRAWADKAYATALKSAKH